jgi:hypothetical protein
MTAAWTSNMHSCIVGVGHNVCDSDLGDSAAEISEHVPHEVVGQGAHLLLLVDLSQQSVALVLTCGWQPQESSSSHIQVAAEGQFSTRESRTAVISQKQQPCVTHHSTVLLKCMPFQARPASHHMTAMQAHQGLRESTKRTAAPCDSYETLLNS